MLDAAQKFARVRAHRDAAQTSRPLPELLPQTGSARLGDFLIENGELSVENHDAARAACREMEATLSEVLRVQGYVTRKAIHDAEEQIWSTSHIDLSAEPPDPQLVQQVGAAFCIAQGIVPVRRFAGGIVVATARPDLFADVATALADTFGQVRMVLADERDVHEALLRHDLRAFARKAETHVSNAESCRDWNAPALRRWLLAFSIVIGIGIWKAPALTFGLFCGWAVMTLLLSTLLKFAAAIAQRNHAHAFHIAQGKDSFPLPNGHRLPRISVLVPLYREREIASRLIGRLRQIDYPRELLEICLITESDDNVTRAAVEQADLPDWMRVIPVPDGTLRTKPRAMNFALDFCKGSIIGIYDAEDAPDPDQLRRVAERFANRGPEVACLQGVLDYYNARTNWLSRCFTIEYATWFRVVLPGLARLGLVIPLGGTTLFFRRNVLEDLGRWDAHNVTEDADLGIRLARHGYKTELLETVTREEANCRLIPWIKQRSRWLKGYAITWAVHMKSPLKLLRQLGPWRFFGFQLLFLGTLSQFVLLPLLWSFWLVPLGIWHPLSSVLPQAGFLALGAVFLFSEIVTIAVGLLAVRGQDHRFLSLWVPSLHIYFPLGALASYKGLWELLSAPFYWDKTRHGVFDQLD